MPKLKRKIKLCKELAAAKKIKTSNKNNLVNIEAFNNDNDVENLGVEELSNNVVEGDSTNEVGGYLEIEIDEDFEWFDNEIEKNAESLYDVFAENLSPGYRVHLKAVQKYLSLRNKGYAKIEASEIVSDLMKKGKWFSRCIRSWSKTFLEYGDVPKSRHGQHLIGSSILDDEDINVDNNVSPKKFPDA
ncbi:6311_t:CDS:2 [Entrophospora sp. SA101]|nr:6311_t:CDS:2 [Entrophospora sp. SA101]